MDKLVIRRSVDLHRKAPQCLRPRELLVPSAPPVERLHRQSSLWTGTVTWCPSSLCWDPVRTGMWGCRGRTCAPRTAAGCSGWSPTSFRGTPARTAALHMRWGGPLWYHGVSCGEYGPHISRLWSKVESLWRLLTKSLLEEQKRPLIMKESWLRLQLNSTMCFLVRGNKNNTHCGCSFVREWKSYNNLNNLKKRTLEQIGSSIKSYNSILSKRESRQGLKPSMSL